MSDKDIKVLWELPCNLCRSPKPINVVKDCENTFWIDKVCDKKIMKVFTANNPHFVGVTNYCWYYDTEESANTAYEIAKKKEEKRLRDLHYQGNTREAVKKFCEKLKENLFEVNTKEYGKVFVVGEDAIDYLFTKLYGDDEG